MDDFVPFIVCGVNSHHNMKQAIIAAILAALATNVNAGSFGFSVVEYSKSVDGQGVPVYYAPAPVQATTAVPVVQAPVAQAPVVQAPAAPVVAAPAPTPNVVAVPNGNGTYTLVPVVNSAPLHVAQPYLIPATQVPLHKERKRFSIGPRFSWD